MSWFIVLFTIFTAPVFAHPVSYQGAIGVMTWNQPFMTDNWITYSFRNDMAIAARTMRLEMEDGSEMNYYAPQLDYLVKRWNGRDYQANIYVFGGYGANRSMGSTEGAGLFGVEADAESRKYFVMGKWEGMWAKRASDFYHVEARLGVAPYEAEFDEIASWFMVQYQYHPDLVRKHVVTPLFRFFYRSFLTEAGVSTKGDWMLNFMFHF